MNCKCGQELKKWGTTFPNPITGLVDVFPSDDGWICAASEAEARCYAIGIKGYIYPHDVKVMVARPTVRRLGLCRIGVWLRVFQKEHKHALT